MGYGCFTGRASTGVQCCSRVAVAAWTAVTVAHLKQILARVLCLIGASMALTMLHACTLESGVRMTSDSTGEHLATRLGFAGCRLSGPLQAETVLDYARRENMALKDPERARRKIT